jgi:hypothetical protein
VAPLLLLSVAAACPICPDPEMHIVSGNQEGVVLAASLVQLEAEYGSWRAGGDRCGAHWYVDAVEGGSTELGTIDSCGLYRAPDRFAPGMKTLEILASQYPIDGCLDCCPYAFIELYPM